MKCKIEDFVRIIAYKTNIIRENLGGLLAKYQSRQNYEQFLKDTLYLLEEEKPFFILDDNYREKIYKIIGNSRFEYKDSELYDMANQIIAQLNNMSLYSLDKENELIDAYICYNEDIRELYFSNLADFLNTIAQDFDLYVALTARDISSVDDVIFIGGVNMFLAKCPDLFKEKGLLKIVEERARKIKSSLNIKEYKKNMGARRLLYSLKETLKNQE